jgi:outer membrane protein, multidrug efflux system
MKLVALMGLPSYAPFKLARPHLCRDEVQLACIEDLEQEALLSRPELVIKDIDEKIMADEVRANIIQMFPGLTLFKSYNYDANRFLENHHWMVVGARATWNLLSIPNLAYTANVARGQKHLARFNRLSLSVGILAQVRLAYLNYLDKLSQYKLAREWSDIRTQLVDVAERERELGEFNDIDVLNFKLVAVFSKYVALKAYAALKISIEQINNSIGRPLLFGGMTWSCQDPNWVCEDEAVSNCEEI